MTRAATQAERFDRERDYRKHEPRPNDPPNGNQIRQVSYLTAYLSTLLALGAIPPEYRAGVRATIDSTRNAFALPDLKLREPTDAA